MSKESADLLVAEGALEFLFEELTSIDDCFSEALLTRLKEEIGKRRNKPLISLMKFLQNPNSLSEKTDSFFAMSSKNEIVKLASEIWEDYFVPEIEELQPIAADAEGDADKGPSENFRDRLGLSIASRKGIPSLESETQSNAHFIKNACNRFVTSKVLPDSLKKIQSALLIIKPTSIRNEENFSASSHFLSDKRSRMTCQNLDDYCFLKSHFVHKLKKNNK